MQPQSKKKNPANDALVCARYDTRKVNASELRASNLCVFASFRIIFIF